VVLSSFRQAQLWIFLCPNDLTPVHACLLFFFAALLIKKFTNKGSNQDTESTNTNIRFLASEIFLNSSKFYIFFNKKTKVVSAWIICASLSELRYLIHKSNRWHRYDILNISSLLGCVGKLCLLNVAILICVINVFFFQGNVCFYISFPRQNISFPNDKYLVPSR
jgi:hypothetical protein